MLEWFRDLIFGKKKEQPPVSAAAPAVNTQITDAVTSAPVAAVAMTGSLAATSMATAASMKPKRKYTKKIKTEKKA